MARYAPHTALKHNPDPQLQSTNGYDPTLSIWQSTPRMLDGSHGSCDMLGRIRGSQLDSPNHSASKKVIHSNLLSSFTSDEMDRHFKKELSSVRHNLAGLRYLGCLRIMMQEIITHEAVERRIACLELQQNDFFKEGMMVACQKATGNGFPIRPYDGTNYPFLNDSQVCLIFRKETSHAQYRLRELHWLD